MWLDKERSELMDTICSGLPFPEIYMHVVTDTEKGRQNHIVVDGQQRITSIMMFIDNEICLPTNDNWAGQYFRDLSEEQKEKLWDYKIVVRSLRKTNDAEIRNLFERLNTNTVSLNDQEIRNAKYVGAFKALAERLADSPIYQNIGLFTPREIRRMLDVEFVSELVILTMAGITNKKDLLDTYYSHFEEELPDEAGIESQFTSVMTLLWSIYTPQNRPYFKSKSNFYTIFGACFQYHTSTNTNSFSNPKSVAAAVTAFLSKVRNQEFETAEIEEYADAVSRAASDRARRAVRNDIMWDVISKADDLETDNITETQPMLLPEENG